MTGGEMRVPSMFYTRHPAWPPYLPLLLLVPRGTVQCLHFSPPSPSFPRRYPPHQSYSFDPGVPTDQPAPSRTATRAPSPSPLSPLKPPSETAGRNRRVTGGEGVWKGGHKQRDPRFPETPGVKIRAGPFSGSPVSSSSSPSFPGEQGQGR